MDKKTGAACLPSQTIGDTYEAAINAHQMLVEPGAESQWDRDDIKVLAHSILGNMLVEPVAVVTFRQGEDVVEEQIARRLKLPKWQERRRMLVDSMDEAQRSKLAIEQFDELARPLSDKEFDEQPEWDQWDDEAETYSVLLHTRLGWVFGKGHAWSFALAKAIAAYMELRKRSDLTIAPISQQNAFEFIDAVHRHHSRPQGWKFGLGAWAVVNDLDTLVGVATVSRPTSRMLEQQGALEVQRVAVLENGQNLCSALYAACWKEAKAIGCRRLVTFILPSESGASLRAGGWKMVKDVAGGGKWGRRGRTRTDKAPTCEKQRWEIVLVNRRKRRMGALEEQVYEYQGSEAVVLVGDAQDFGRRQDASSLLGRIGGKCAWVASLEAKTRPDGLVLLRNVLDNLDGQGVLVVATQDQASSEPYRSLGFEQTAGMALRQR